MEGSVLDRVEELERKLRILETQHKMTVLAIRVIVSDLALADRTLLLAALHALTDDGKEALNELTKVGALIDSAEKMAQEHKDLVVPHAD